MEITLINICANTQGMYFKPHGLKSCGNLYKLITIITPNFS